MTTQKLGREKSKHQEPRDRQRRANTMHGYNKPLLMPAARRTSRVRCTLRKSRITPCRWGARNGPSLGSLWHGPFMVVKVHAVSLAPGDWRSLSGLTRGMQGPKSFPHIPGGDLCGTVTEIPGEGAEKLNLPFGVGDRVAARFTGPGPKGALCEYAVVGHVRCGQGSRRSVLGWSSCSGQCLLRRSHGPFRTRAKRTGVSSFSVRVVVCWEATSVSCSRTRSRVCGGSLQLT
jgi:hypothetical protein